MDYFEGLIKTLLEQEGYWVRQSFKVNVTKQEKRDAVFRPFEKRGFWSKSYR